MNKICKKINEKTRNEKGKILISICVSLGLFFMLVIILRQQIQYNIALKFIDEYKYDKAYGILCKLSNYKDTEGILKEFIICPEETVKRSSLGDTSTQYVYDERGNCVKETIFSWVGDKYVIHYTYDDNNNCIKKAQKNSTIEYKYNSYGNLIKEKHYTNDPIEIEYYYDIKNNLIQTISYHSNGKVGMTREYFYDENNNCVKEVASVPEGQRFAETSGNKIITEYTYDKNGNCIKKASDNHVEEYVYNEKNNIVKEISRYSEIEYIYDDNGFCIREIETYSDGSGETVTEHKNYRIFYCKK